MANKVAVPEGTDGGNESPIIKKRSKCCTCCLIFVIVMLVIFGAAFGVGWYFGDKFTKEYFGMSLGDTLGVASDLYWTDDADVVKRPFKKSDVDGFYTEIKRNLLLKEDAEVDFDAALIESIEKYFNADGAKPAYNDALAGTPESGGKDNSLLDVFTDMIASVFNRENIDIELLEAYDESAPSGDEYIFNLNDKQLAAFVSAVLDSALKNAGAIDSIKEYSTMMDLSKVVELKQIIFKAKSVKNADGTQNIEATTADVTIWIGLQDAAGQAIKYFMKDAGFGWAGGMAAWFGDVILPENLYVTMSLPLFGDGAPQIKINDMGAKDMARAKKLIDGIISQSGGSKTLDELLTEFGNKMKPYLESATRKMEFDDAAHGNIKMDLLDTIISMASDKDQSDRLTKSDFIYLLQALLSDGEQTLKTLEPYRFKNIYIDADGKEVFIDGGSTELTPIDYEQLFIAEIENKYSIEFKDDAKLNDVLAMLGVSVGGTAVKPTDLLDMIDAQRFNASLDMDIGDLELVVTDRMLAAALDGQLDKLISGNGSGFENISMSLVALSFIKKPNMPNNLFALVAAEVDVGEMMDSLGADSLASKLAAGIMPEKILIKLVVDVTRDRPAGVEPEKTEFVINSCKNSDRAIATLEKLVPSLSMASMIAKIESSLNEMLDSMYKHLDVRLVPSSLQYDDDKNTWTGEHGEIVLPDIFTVVTDSVLVNSEGERAVTPQQLKDVLRGLNNVDAFPSEPSIADGYGEFIEQVVDKYYLKPAPTDDMSSFDGLTKFMSEFDTNKFRISGTDETVKYLAHDRRTVDMLRPVMTDKQLGALLADEIAKDAGGEIGNYRIADVRTDTDEITVLLSVSVGELLPENVGFLLAADTAFITATVDLSRAEGDGEALPFRYPVTLMLNEMNDQTYAATLDIVRFFTPDFDIQSQVERFGEILYEQLSVLNDSIGAAAPSVPEGEPAEIGPVTIDMFELTPEGLVMIDFYTFLAGKMGLVLGGGTTAETVKAALQGMYMRSETASLVNENNYLLNDILRNRPAPDQKEWSDETYVDMMTRGGMYTDKEFNGFLKRGVESIDGSGGVKVVQTTVLHAGDDSARAQDIRDWANVRRDPTTAEISMAEDYMFVTFAMSMSDFMESNNGGAHGFYPNTVYATLVYKKTLNGGVDDFTQTNLIFNNMRNAEYRIIVDLMSLNEDSSNSDKVNIMTISERSAEVLDALAKRGKIEFGDALGGDCVGTVTYTPVV